MPGHKVYRAMNRPSTVLGVNMPYLILGLSLGLMAALPLKGHFSPFLSKILSAAVVLPFVAGAHWVSWRDPMMPLTLLKWLGQKSVWDPLRDANKG